MYTEMFTAIFQDFAKYYPTLKENIDATMNYFHQKTKQLVTEKLSAIIMESLRGGQLINRVPQEVSDLFEKNFPLPCPEEISIPSIFDVYNFAHTTSMQGARANFQKRYAESVQKCTQCGACADKCPQNIEIPQLLKIIDTELGTA